MTVSLALAACSGPGGSAATGPRPALLPVEAPASSATRPAASSRYIKHVVIVIQENRTFDDFFATYPGADGTATGKLHTGQVVQLKKTLLSGPELSNGRSSYVTAYDNGKMDGFDLESWGGKGPAGLVPYTYVDPAKIKPYWAIAHQYALGDHMFQGQGSGSFTAHQELIAGGEQINWKFSLIDWPFPPKQEPFAWGCDAPAGTATRLITRDDVFRRRGGPFPCLKYATLADRLDAAKLSWRYYSGLLKLGGAGYMWNAFEAIGAVRYGPDWNSDISTPSNAIFGDLKKGHLAGVTWVTPSVPDSDHEYGGPDHGPSWVAQVVNAIGQSPDWSSTAIVVVWDDWGGHYDHVAPRQLGFGGLGFRVPMLVISPYVRAGRISHTPYEFGSILKFVEDNWGLQPMQDGDRRAASIADIFDFKQAPRKFAPIPALESRSYFEHEAPSNLSGDGG